jgi:hypothetical protein
MSPSQRRRSPAPSQSTLDDRAPEQVREAYDDPVRSPRGYPWGDLARRYARAVSQEGAQQTSPVTGVSAHVELGSGYQIAVAPELGSEVPEIPASARSDPARYYLNVRLSALTESGERVSSPHADFGIGGSRRGVGAIWHRYRGPTLSEDPAEQTELLNQTYRAGLSDIEDAINQMLGRDPEQHRPPRLSWRQLIDALASAGVSVTEQDLIDAPLTVELSPPVKADLDLP